MEVSWPTTRRAHCWRVNPVSIHRNVSLMYIQRKKQLSLPGPFFFFFFVFSTLFLLSSSFFFFLFYLIFLFNLYRLPCAVLCTMSKLLLLLELSLQVLNILLSNLRFLSSFYSHVNQVIYFASTKCLIL